MESVAAKLAQGKFHTGLEGSQRLNRSQGIGTIFQEWMLLWQKNFALNSWGKKSTLGRCKTEYFHVQSLIHMHS